MNHNKEIVMVRGGKPFICNKYDYSRHPEADKLEDMSLEEQKERFRENIELDNDKKTENIRKQRYSFKDF